MILRLMIYIYTTHTYKYIYMYYTSVFLTILTELLWHTEDCGSLLVALTTEPRGWAAQTQPSNPKTKKTPKTLENMF